MILRQYRRGLITSKEVNMNYYDDNIDRERFLSDNIQLLEETNKEIAKLNLQKEEITENIIHALGHEHEGQKTYEYQTWKIEVKTPFVYSLNKKLYESGKIKLPESYNPVKQSVAYSIDKKLCDQYLQSAPKKVRDVLVELIDKKPGKAGITIKERIS